MDINLIDAVDEVFGRTALIICACKKTDAHLKIADYLLDCGCKLLSFSSLLHFINMSGS